MSGVQGQAIWSALQRVEERCKAELSTTEQELQRTLYGYESRLERLRYAIKASGPLACRTLVATLEGIKLDAIWNILYSIVHDIALYYGGSVVAGTAMGAAAGSLAGGIGAAPGAAVGFGAGQLMGTWVMTFLGLKMFAEGLSDTVPQAFALYWKAFRAAWGPIKGDPHDARYRADFALSEDQAAHHFAHGHVLMIMAILMALVAWLTRGGTSEEALMQAVRQSERLGAKMADWLTENKQKLINHPRLRPVLRERAPSLEKQPESLGGKRIVGGSQKAGDVPGPSPIRVLRIRSAEDVNNEMIAAGNQPAWLSNTKVITQVVPKGTQYQMVVSEAQAQALAQGEPWFGGWATPDAIPSQAFARDDLAILPEFKPDVSYVVTVETTAPQTVNAGFVGPLGDGGGGASQVEFVGQRNLQLVGQPQSLPER